MNETSFEDALEKALPRDRTVEYTTVGIHKDDLEFTINGYPLKKYASQGQQKSFLIALKLAQFDFIKSIKQVTPILLLDDIYDKLDDLRVKQLMELVCSDNFGQLFITDTHLTRLSDLFKATNADFKVFKINNGNAKELKAPPDLHKGEESQHTSKKEDLSGNSSSPLESLGGANTNNN